MIILFFEVGPVASIAGVAFMGVLMPMQRFVAVNIGTLRRHMVKLTDLRVKRTNEILQLIRAIKYYAWERSLEQRVAAVRDEETSKLWEYLVVNGMLRELLFVAIPLAAYIIFTTFAVLDDSGLTVVKVFRVLAYLNILRFPLNLFGEALKFLSDSSVSLHRLRDFFLLSTRPPLDRSCAKGQDASITLSNASFAWGVAEGDVAAVSPGAFRLQDLDLTVRAGELVAVIGSVGSGKSSFVSAILGEMARIKGSLHVSGRIAYASQSPWIQNMSLRDNVLFGADDSDEQVAATYKLALRYAALEPDLQMLANGDKTEIGERGINLSGGQKARVALARVLVAAQRSDIAILDDPFSAVDGSTGNHMFEKGVLMGLQNKLRVVILNSHMHLLPKFDRVVYLDNGQLIAQGALDELMASEHGDAIRRLIGGENNGAVHQELGSPQSTGDELQADEAEELCLTTEMATDIKPARKRTQTSDSTPSIAHDSAAECDANAGRLIEREQKAIGGITSRTYAQYFGASILPIRSAGSIATDEKRSQDEEPSPLLGALIIIALISIFAIAQVFRVAVDLEVVYWAKRDDGRLNSAYFDRYTSAVFILIVLVLLRVSSLYTITVRSSINIHNSIFRHILAASVPFFFDTHTVGEILNRFSKDMENIDTFLPELLLQFLVNWFQVIAIFVLCLWSTPLFAIFMLPMLVVFYWIFKSFSCSSRDLKRMESVSRTPIYSSFSETLSGLETIRAFNDTDRFFRAHLKRMDRNHCNFFHLWMSTSWVTARLEIIVSCVMFAVALFAVVARDTLSPVMVGMALVYALQLTALFQRCVQLSIDVQTYFTSAERILEYRNAPLEVSVHDQYEHQRLQKRGALMHWPSKGDIEFNDIWLRYRNNDPVLKGVTFRVEGGQRIGVCGRTGAGKSSVMVSLFRMVESYRGSIFIDGVNIALVPLQLLRTQLAIIPQDPVLFTGSIRYQLDPFDQYEDVRIWEVLETVGMKQTIGDMPNGLAEEVAEGGENLSLGQCQLLCIARALLRRSRILVMDEATSAIDPYTDECIQRVLRSGSVNDGTTVLTIAHRLDTIIDYDRILVLSDGVVIEYAPPDILLRNPDSVFSDMYNGYKNMHT